jgi:hypothetical protein
MTTLCSSSSKGRTPQQRSGVGSCGTCWVTWGQKVHSSLSLSSRAARSLRSRAWHDWSQARLRWKNSSEAVLLQALESDRDQRGLLFFCSEVRVASTDSRGSRSTRRDAGFQIGPCPVSRSPKRLVGDFTPERSAGAWGFRCLKLYRLFRENYRSCTCVGTLGFGTFSCGGFFVL